MSTLVEFLVLAVFALAAAITFYSFPGWPGLAATLILLVLGGAVSQWAAGKVRRAGAGGREDDGAPPGGGARHG